jgi:hypothetical protein
MDTGSLGSHQQPIDPGSARLQLLDLLGGFLRTQALATVARLGVADIVGKSLSRLRSSPLAWRSTRLRSIA